MNRLAPSGPSCAFHAVDEELVVVVVESIFGVRVGVDPEQQSDG